MNQLKKSDSQCLFIRASKGNLLDFAGKPSEASDGSAVSQGAGKCRAVRGGMKMKWSGMYKWGERGN